MREQNGDPKKHPREKSVLSEFRRVTGYREGTDGGPYTKYENRLKNEEGRAISISYSCERQEQKEIGRRETGVKEVRAGNARPGRGRARRRHFVQDSGHSARLGEKNAKK